MLHILTAAPEKYGYDGGFTCAGFTAKEVKALTEAEKPGKKTKKKGFVQLMTSLGPLNLELHCDLVPKACENFLTHCAAGYYNNVTFHRSIKNFMVCSHHLPHCVLAIARFLGLT